MEPISPEPEGARRPYLPWRLFTLTILAGFLIAAMPGISFYIGWRLNTVYAPTVNAALMIKEEAALAHLWLEEILAGDTHDRTDLVWNKMDRAEGFGRALLTGGTFQEGVFAPLRDPEIRASVLRVMDSLTQLRDISVLRLEQRDRSGVGTDIDQQYDSLFMLFIHQADQIRDQVGRIMERDLETFRIIQVSLIGACLILSFFTGLMIFRFERSQAKSLDALHRANQGLKTEIEIRRKAEADLQESEERFRQLAENIQDVFVLYGIRPKARLMYASPAFEPLWGRKTEELYADMSVIPESIHREDRAAVAQTMEEFIRREEACDLEFRIVRPDGSTRWIWARGFAIRDKNGRMYRTAVLAQDITRRKQEEQRQKELVEELKTFTYVVSHDLRAPLINFKGFTGEIRKALEDISPSLHAGLAGFPEKTRQQIAATLEKDLPDSLDYLSCAVGHMEKLVQAVLMLSRIGHRELRPETLNTGAMVADILDRFAYQIRQKGIRVSVGPLPEIFADRMALDQVFSNLLSNAINYMGAGRPGRIEIDGERRPDEAVFRIRDNGRGVEDADRERIFFMFQRAGDQDVPGEGMGLSYVRALLRRHAGRIWCEAGQGEGSVFVFTIPCRPEPPGTEA